MTTEDDRKDEAASPAAPPATSPQTAPEPPAAADASAGAAGVPLWMAAAVALLVSLLVTLVAVAAHAALGAKPQRFAMVDIAEVVQIKELLVTAKAARAGATDKDREALFDEVKQFGAGLESAVAEVAQECDCVLLVRAAVVRGAEDLTPLLKRKAGLGETTLQQAGAALRAAGKEGAPPAAAEGAR